MTLCKMTDKTMGNRQLVFIYTKTREDNIYRKLVRVVISQSDVEYSQEYNNEFVDNTFAH